MSKLDRIKEEISWLKLVFGLLVAVDVSLIGWTANNYPVADIRLVLAALVVVIVTTAGIIHASKTVHRRIEDLEEL
ncbi:MAG: hypothetical protein WD558_03660 [Pseudomonadales bacterium]